MARPRLDDDDRRDIIIPVKFSPAEHRELERRAGDRPLSTYLRERALADDDAPPATPGRVRTRDGWFIG